MLNRLNAAILPFAGICGLLTGCCTTRTVDDSGGLRAVLVISGDPEDVRAKTGLENVSWRSITFMSCGWINHTLELRSVEGQEVPRTEAGRQWAASFAPAFPSRRAVLHQEIGRGKIVWINHDIPLNRFFQFPKSGQYKVRVIFEDRFPEHAAKAAGIWTGKTVSDWIFFSVSR